MLRKLKQFVLFPAADRRLLLLIAALVPFVEFSLKAFGFNRIFNLINRWTTRPPQAEINREEVNKYARLMFLSYRNSPLGGKCLARSLVLWGMLRRKGIETDLRFGMKKKDGKLLAHAWIEYRGEPLEQIGEYNQNYVPFVEPISPKTMRQSN
jgi:hypothetical protein